MRNPTKNGASAGASLRIVWTTRRGDVTRTAAITLSVPALLLMGLLGSQFGTVLRIAKSALTSLGAGR